MKPISLLALASLCCACATTATGASPQDRVASQKGATMEKEVQSLDELKDPETRAAVAAATRKDAAAGVPLGKLASIRMTIARAADGTMFSKGFSFNIVVSDHAGFLAALNPSQRADYRRFLASVSVSTDEQIAAFAKRARVLLGHDESDPSPGLKLLDAQLVQDNRVAASSPFAPFLRPCGPTDGPGSTCAVAAGGAGSDAGSAARPTSSAADDWSRVQVGDGPVPTQIRNASDHDLIMRIRDGSGRVVAQIGLGAGASASARLPRGSLQTLLRLVRGGQISYFRGPGIDVPPTASQLNLTLEGATIGNLTPIAPSEFNQ